VVLRNVGGGKRGAEAGSLMATGGVLVSCSNGYRPGTDFYYGLVYLILHSEILSIILPLVVLYHVLLCNRITAYLGI